MDILEKLLEHKEDQRDLEGEYTILCHDLGCAADEIERLRKQVDMQTNEKKDLNLCIVGFCMHSYGQIDGSVNFPNSKEGDFLKSLFENALPPAPEDI